MAPIKADHGEVREVQGPITFPLKQAYEDSLHDLTSSTPDQVYDKSLDLIMGTDGLWDVMKNSEVHKVVKETLLSANAKEDDFSQIIAR